MILEKLFILFCLYLPFQVALNPGEGIDLASSRVFILLLVFVWLAEGLRRGKIAILPNIRSGLVISFIFFACFSSVVASNPDWSLRKAIFLLSVFPIYFVASAVLVRPGALKRACHYLIIGGMLISGLGIVQFFLQFFVGLEAVYSFWAKYIAPIFLGTSFSEAVLLNPSWLVNIAGETYLRAIALFPDPHMFSFYLGMMAPLALGMALESKDRRLFHSLSFLAILIADVLTFSRGGYLGLFAGMLFLLVIFWRRISFRQRYGFLLGGVLFLAVVLVPSPVSQRFRSIFDFKEGSNVGRLEMWKKAYEVTLDNPFLGVGLGNYPLEVRASAGYREPIYAHNTYLDISAEAGLPALLAWLGLLGLSLRALWARAGKNRLSLFLAASLVIFLAHSLVETGIYSPVVLSLLLIILSFANIKDKKDVLSVLRPQEDPSE